MAKGFGWSFHRSPDWPSFFVMLSYMSFRSSFPLIWRMDFNQNGNWDLPIARACSPRLHQHYVLATVTQHPSPLPLSGSARSAAGASGTMTRRKRTKKFTGSKLARLCVEGSRNAKRPRCSDSASVSCYRSLQCIQDRPPVPWEGGIVEEYRTGSDG
jgi:hypothetical protein